MNYTTYETTEERNYWERIGEIKALGKTRLRMKFQGQMTPWALYPSREECPVWNWALRFFRKYPFLNEDDALDLAQETICRYLEKEANGIDIRHPLGYARRLCASVLKDYIDEHSALYPPEDLERVNVNGHGMPVDQPDKSTMPKERDVEFADWLTRTFPDPIMQDVLHMIADGMTKADVAHALDIPGGRITRMIRRARTYVPVKNH